YQQFSQVLPLAEGEPFTGTLDISFTSDTQKAEVSTSNWYTSAKYAHKTAYSTTSAIGTTSTVQWQNSTMIAVLRHSDGERLWSGDYDYQGAWDVSSFTVKTPEQAARLVARRLKERFTKDAGG